MSFIYSPVQKPTATALGGRTSASERDATLFAGADASIKINAAIADLGGNPGIVDARGLTGAQTLSVTVAVLSNVTLRLGAASFTWTGSGATFTVADHSAIIGVGSEQTIVFNSTTTGLAKSGTTVYDVELRGFSIRDNNTGASTTIGFDFTEFNRSLFFDLDVWYKLKGYVFKQTTAGNYYNRGFHLKTNDVKTSFDFDATGGSVNENQFYGTDIHKLAGTWDAGGGEIGVSVSGVGNEFYGIHIVVSGTGSKGVQYKPSPAANNHNNFYDIYFESLPEADIDATNSTGKNTIYGFLSDGRTEPVVLDNNLNLTFHTDASGINLNGASGQPNEIWARSTAANGSGTGTRNNFTSFYPPSATADATSPTPLTGAIAYRSDLLRERFFDGTNWHSLIGADTTDTLTNKSIAASEINSGTLALAQGGTNADLSATGGTSQVLKQGSAGAAVTVAQLAASDLSDGNTGSGNIVHAGGNPIITSQLNVNTSEPIISMAASGAGGDKTWMLISGGGANIGAGTFALRNDSDARNPVRLASTAITDSIFIDGTGVGIRNASVSYPLDVVGDINTSTIYRAGGTAGVTQTALVPTSLATIGGIVTTFVGTSDERLKVSRPYGGGLNEILAITPIRYRWNARGQEIGGDGSREFVGFGAQNVQAIIPEAVVGKQATKDGTEYLGFDDRPVIAALVNAVKELSTKVQELERKLERCTLATK